MNSPIKAAVFGDSEDSRRVKEKIEKWYNPYIRSASPDEDILAVTMTISGMTADDIYASYMSGTFEIIVIPESELRKHADLISAVISCGVPDDIIYIIRQSDLESDDLTGREADILMPFHDSTPYLVVKGDKTCYSILDTFAEQIGTALQILGENVEYYDITVHDSNDLTALIGRRFKAVIEMQQWTMFAKFTDGSFLMDTIDAPLYQFVFDHPVWYGMHFDKAPRRLTVLCPDGNYTDFIRRYYHKNAVFLPPGGVIPEVMYRPDAPAISEFLESADGTAATGSIHGVKKIRDRKYDISFVGSCLNHLFEDLQILHDRDHSRFRFAMMYLQWLRQYYNLAPDTVLWNMIKSTDALERYYGVSADLSDSDFEKLFSDYKWMIVDLAHYYKQKVLKCLLDAGLTVHVYGVSWDNHIFTREYPNLIHHPDAIGEDALQAYAESKISLNIMTWHKDGFTERIANSMLEGAVCVSDETEYLKSNFTDGKDIILFDLSEESIHRLPDRIQALLDDNDTSQMIADNGYNKALHSHTWLQRAVELIKMPQA